VSPPTTPNPALAVRRRPTRRVLVGDVPVGGGAPIAVQSMTTTRTTDTEATAQQARRLAEAGCQIVRVTVPTLDDARALEPLRRRLEELGVRVPLVADIHFNPKAAMLAADFVEKVRVNPGNFADSKRFAVREYTDGEYAAELDRVREKLAPLVDKCKRLGRAMRIGTNHGSLSDRVMNRFGDSPLGMVESALEFVRLCREQEYHDLVLSMKASNPFVAIQAYRLLAERMDAEGMDYPFHLGVTEAGDGEDGRAKSAIGIGSLLADGLGDTVRVSLTEDPVLEIPVARALVAPYDLSREARAAAPTPADLGLEVPWDRFSYERRPTSELAFGGSALGGAHPVQVWLDLGPAEDGEALAARVRDHASWRTGDDAKADVVHVRVGSPAALAALGPLRAALWSPERRVPLAITTGCAVTRDDEALASVLGAADLLLLEPSGTCPGGWSDEIARLAARCRDAQKGFGVSLEADSVSPAQSSLPLAEALARSAVEATAVARSASGRVPLLAIALPPDESPVNVLRLATCLLDQAGLDDAPLLLVDRAAQSGSQEPRLETAVRIGGLLADGLGDALRVDGTDPATALRRAFGVLQVTRLRMSRPDYIACPSCGRTLFDLEEVTARIKSATSHLKGVKIAIMGCIVNGPGEMADADFGYVGSAPGKINLYVKKDCVEKNLPAEIADARLIELIKQHGAWVDPPPIGA